jgi:hypothetical protein
MLSGSLDSSSNRTKMHHFNQGKPQQKVWNLWHKANFIWSNGVQLEQPLGQWLVPQASQRQRCKVYYNHPDKSLYYRDLRAIGEKFHRYPTSSNSALPLESNYELVDLPSTAFPTRISSDHEWQSRALHHSYPV